MSEHTNPASQTVADELRRLTGLSAARCYQCGKCSAGCPMAEEMGGCGPHVLLRLAQLDQRERLLHSEAIWLCLTCETCSARCPNEVDPARLIDGMRELALRHDPDAPPRSIRSFHRSFLDQIRRNGRIHEVSLVAGYKLRSGDLFSDVLTAPGLMVRGKLPLLPHAIDGVEEVRRIFAACEAVTRQQAEDDSTEAGGHTAPAHHG